MKYEYSFEDFLLQHPVKKFIYENLSEYVCLITLKGFNSFDTPEQYQDAKEIMSDIMEEYYQWRRDIAYNEWANKKQKGKRMNSIPDQPTIPPMPEKECKLIYASLARDITEREKARVDKENFENKRNEIIELINKAIYEGKYKIEYPLSIHKEIIEELYMYGYDITKEIDSPGIGIKTTWIISWEGEEK